MSILSFSATFSFSIYTRTESIDFLVYNNHISVVKVVFFKTNDSVASKSVTITKDSHTPCFVCVCVCVCVCGCGCGCANLCFLYDSQDLIYNTQFFFPLGRGRSGLSRISRTFL